MDTLLALVDPMVLLGCTVSLAIGGFIMLIMKYSFASREAEYGEHISTLYGTNSNLRTKAAKAAEKKKKAKQAKVSQAKAVTVDKTPDTRYGQHRVEIDPDPMVLGENSAGEPVAPPTKVKARKRKMSKSILHNKDELSLVQEGPVESRLEFLTNHSIPVDEAEMLSRKQQQLKLKDSEAQKSSSRDDEVEHSLPTIEVVEDAVLPVKSSNQHAAITQLENEQDITTTDSNVLKAESTVSDSPRRTGKKGKGKAASSEGSDNRSGLDRVLESISQSGLSEGEVQRLIDTLLDKHGSRNWDRKSSVAGRLDEATKEVESLKTALEGERTNSAWANDKLKEATNQCSAADRSHMTTKGQLQEMQMRTQQLLEQQRAEVQGIQQARFQEIQRMQQHVQQIREENQSLRQALPNSEEMAQMRTQLRAVEAELKDQQRHVVKSEAKCQDLTARLSRADEGHRQENMRCVELASKVDEFTYKQPRLDKQLIETQSRAHAAENDLRNLQDHLRTKDVEIKELHSEILAAKQATSDTVSSTSEADNSRILELESNVAAVQAALDSKSSEIAYLHEQLTQTRDDLEKANVVKPQANGTAVVAGAGGDGDHVNVSVLEDGIAKLQTEVEALRDKNNELRKKNWTMSESLDKAETAAAAVSLLEAEVDKSSSKVHELKAINQALKEQNSELQSKVDQICTTTSHSEELRRELNLVKQTLDEKEEIIAGLESAVSEERERVTATEHECKNLLENELYQSLAAIENQHKSRIDDLQSSLDQSEARITDLEKLLHQSETKIKQIGLNGIDVRNGSAEMEDLRHKLGKAREENKYLRVRVSKLESSLSDSDADSIPATQLKAMLKKLNPDLAVDANLSSEQSLQEFYKQAVSQQDSPGENHYKQALIEAEAMLDKLSETWLGKLSDKDTQISSLQAEVQQHQAQLQSLSHTTNKAPGPINFAPWDLVPPPSFPPPSESVSSNSGSENSSRETSSAEDLFELGDTSVCRSCERSEPRRLSHLLAMRLASSGSLQDVSSTV